MGNILNSRKLSLWVVAGLILTAAFVCLTCPIGHTEKFSVGSENEDWWIEYPDQHVDSGDEVEHPSWVLDALEDRPVVILFRREGCVGCAKQNEAIEVVLDDVGNDAADYRVLSSDSGDVAKYIEAYQTYYPTGTPKSVPMTVISTLVLDSDDEVQVGWHSYVGYNTLHGGEIIRSYMEDAIDRHGDLIGDWDR